MHPCFKRGFTLIELLVVIAIISIIAAIVFPVFAQARAAARKTVCMSNFKQIGTAMLMYSGDWDEKFARTQTSDNPGTPGYISWWSTAYYEQALNAYIKDGVGGVTSKGSQTERNNVWWDPSDPDKSDAAMWGSVRNNGLITGTTRTLSDLSAPAHTIFFTLHVERWRDYECTSPWNDTVGTNCEPSPLPVNNPNDPFWFSDYFDICLNPWSYTSLPTDTFYWKNGFAAPPCEKFPSDVNCIYEYRSIDGRYWNFPPERARYSGGHPFAFMDGHVKIISFDASYVSATNNMWSTNQDSKPVGY